MGGVPPGRWTGAPGLGAGGLRGVRWGRPSPADAQAGGRLLPTGLAASPPAGPRGARPAPPSPCPVCPWTPAAWAFAYRCYGLRGSLKGWGRGCPGQCAGAASRGALGPARPGLLRARCCAHARRRLGSRVVPVRAHPSLCMKHIFLQRILPRPPHVLLSRSLPFHLFLVGSV